MLPPTQSISRAMEKLLCNLYCTYQILDSCRLWIHELIIPKKKKKIPFLDKKLRDCLHDDNIITRYENFGYMVNVLVVNYE